jgi:hypothetical protein
MCVVCWKCSLTYIYLLHGKYTRSNVQNNVFISEGFKIILSGITGIDALKETCTNDTIVGLACK